MYLRCSLNGIFYILLFAYPKIKNKKTKQNKKNKPRAEIINIYKSKSGRIVRVDGQVTIWFSFNRSLIYGE